MIFIEEGWKEYGVGQKLLVRYREAFDFLDAEPIESLIKMFSSLCENLERDTTKYSEIIQKAKEVCYYEDKS